MTDFTKRPYSEWIEQSITQLFEMEPENIMFAAKFPDNTVGTAYYNCQNGDRFEFIRAVFTDCATEWIRLNADVISSILSGDGEHNEN